MVWYTSYFVSEERHSVMVKGFYVKLTQEKLSLLIHLHSSKMIVCKICVKCTNLLFCTVIWFHEKKWKAGEYCTKSEENHTLDGVYEIFVSLDYTLRIFIGELDRISE